MADKFLTLDGGDPALKEAKDSSAGAGDAGKLVALDSGGKINSNMMPPGIGADSVTAPASENLSAGDVINIWDDAGTVKIRKADASTTGKEADGFVTSAVTSGADAEAILDGTISGLSGLTKGANYYLSESAAGGVTETAPSASGEIVQKVGKAVSATELAFEKGEHYKIL